MGCPPMQSAATPMHQAQGVRQQICLAGGSQPRAHGMYPPPACNQQHHTSNPPGSREPPDAWLFPSAGARKVWQGRGPLAQPLAPHEEPGSPHATPRAGTFPHEVARDALAARPRCLPAGSRARRSWRADAAAPWPGAGAGAGACPPAAPRRARSLGGAFPLCRAGGGGGLPVRACKSGGSPAANGSAAPHRAPPGEGAAAAPLPRPRPRRWRPGASRSPQPRDWLLLPGVAGGRAGTRGLRVAAAVCGGLSSWGRAGVRMLHRRLGISPRVTRCHPGPSPDKPSRAQSRPCIRPWGCLGHPLQPPQPSLTKQSTLAARITHCNPAPSLAKPPPLPKYNLNPA